MSNRWRLSHRPRGSGRHSLPGATAKTRGVHTGETEPRRQRRDAARDSAGGTIAFEVEDLDRFMTDLKDKGSRMAVCLDSEVNSILLHQLKPK
jgi:hypothetical protein